MPERQARNGEEKMRRVISLDIEGTESPINVEHVASLAHSFNGASVHVSFGRNVGDKLMMTDDQWAEFGARIRRAISNAALTSGMWEGHGDGAIQIERKDGTGYWQSESGELIRESSAVFSVWGLSLYQALNLYGLVRSALYGVAAQFGQDAIGVTLGLGELVGDV